MKQRQFTVTPKTGAFIDALDALEHANNLFYTALVNQYGEENGGKIYDNTRANWDTVTANISEYLTAAIISNFAPVHGLNDDISI